MGLLATRNLMDGTHVFHRFTEIEGPNGPEIIDDPLLDAPDASTMHAASEALFNEPGEAVQQVRANPQDSHYVYATDQRYLDPGFRIQQATRILLDGEDGLEDPTPDAKRIHSYWISHFCVHELNELTAKANRAYFQAQEASRQKPMQESEHSLLNRVINVIRDPNGRLLGIGVGTFVIMWAYYSSPVIFSMICVLFTVQIVALTAIFFTLYSPETVEHIVRATLDFTFDYYSMLCARVKQLFSQEIDTEIGNLPHNPDLATRRAIWVRSTSELSQQFLENAISHSEFLEKLKKIKMLARLQIV